MQILKSNNFFIQLEELFPKVEFINISNELIYSRSIKIEEEILVFKELIGIQDRALLMVMNNLKTGVSEKKLSYIYI